MHRVAEVLKSCCIAIACSAAADARRTSPRNMVFFVCEDCNETLKRLKVAAHLCKCSCSAITCVDCNKSFYDDSYLQHSTCMSEAERYEGHLYQAPKKRSAQDAWSDVVEGSAGERADVRVGDVLRACSSLARLPRDDGDESFGAQARVLTRCEHQPFDEVLAAVKVENCLDAERKRNLEEVIGPITETYFQEIYGHAMKINDYEKVHLSTFHFQHSCSVAPPAAGTKTNQKIFHR